MRSTLAIANLKQNLSQMRLEVHDGEDEIEIYRSPHSSSGEDSSVYDRRASHQSAQSKSPLRANGIGVDSRYKEETEQYKAEIQRLHASEAEIKALSVNYAALLKEKEEQISRLMNKQNVIKAGHEKSPGKPNGNANQLRTNSSVNYTQKGVITKQDALSNGIPPGRLNQGNGKELSSTLQEHSRSVEAMQAKYEREMQELRMELMKERENSANIQLKLQEEDRSNRSFQKEILNLKLEKDQHNRELKEVQDQLSEKMSEIRRLQLEFTRRDSEEGDESTESLKRVIANLEQENNSLKMEKGELEAALKVSATSLPNESRRDDLDITNKHPSNLTKVNSSKIFPGVEEMEQSIQKLEKELKGACHERDKALQQLSRLKQHLLDKELEESDKMDEDSRIIEELRETCNYQRAQISHLEKALKQAIEGQEEVKKINYDELQKSKEIVNELQQRLASCAKTIDAKNNELLNLQTALGQYYAESEAKERLERDLVHAREESAKLCQLLKDASQQVEISKRDKEEVLAKLSHTERMTSEGKQTLRKLEEDNVKLRRALEQSMTRLNRMSMDSDYFVDRFPSSTSWEMISSLVLAAYKKISL